MRDSPGARLNGRDSEHKNIYIAEMPFLYVKTSISSAHISEIDTCIASRPGVPLICYYAIPLLPFLFLLLLQLVVQYIPAEVTGGHGRAASVYMYVCQPMDRRSVEPPPPPPSFDIVLAEVYIGVIPIAKAIPTLCVLRYVYNREVRLTR